MRRYVFAILSTLCIGSMGLAGPSDLQCELRKETRVGYFELVEKATGGPSSYNPDEYIANISMDDALSASARYVGGQLTVGIGRSEDVLTKPTRDFSVSTTVLESTAQLRFNYTSPLGYDMGTYLFTCSIQ